MGPGLLGSVLGVMGAGYTSDLLELIDLGIGTSVLGPGIEAARKSLSVVPPRSGVRLSCRGLGNLGHLGTVAEVAQLFGVG